MYFERVRKGKITFFHRTSVDHSHFEKAVNWIPDDPDLLEKSISIVSMYDGYAKRINPIIAEDEVVIICDKSFPRTGAPETDSGFRHFVFILLHELAHIYKGHPFIADEENKQYEDEADNQAGIWFNNYAKKSSHNEIKVEMAKSMRDHIDYKWGHFVFDARKKDETLAKLEFKGE